MVNADDPPFAVLGYFPPIRLRVVRTLSLCLSLSDPLEKQARSETGAISGHKMDLLNSRPCSVACLARSATEPGLAIDQLAAGP